MGRFHGRPQLILGGGIVGAYEVEAGKSASIWWPKFGLPVQHREDTAGPTLARRPEDETLEHWFWDEQQVPWWIAVRCGVHYSLVQYWLYEADIPVMRRNVPDRLLE